MIECNQDKGKRLDYYLDQEGREKLLINIRCFVRSLDIIKDFNNWLKTQSTSRVKKI